MPSLPSLKPVSTCALLAVLLVACSGNVPAAPTAPADRTPGAPGASTPTPLTAATPTSGQPTPDGPAGTHVPGSVRYRVANLTNEPVDVYVRSQGLVRAWLVHQSLGYGEVTDYIAPPDPGALVVTAADAGDSECVGTCPHFVGSWGNTNASGDQITVYIHGEGGADLWEQPDPDDVGRFANALPPADPQSATFFAVGRAVDGADFGLRLAYAGDEGCALDVNQSNLLVGGTSVLPFAFSNAVEVTVHANGDRDCDGAPLGEPITISGPAGSRSLLLLHGSVDAVESMVLEIPE